MRIIFLRKSPERLHYSKAKLMITIGCAVLLGFIAHRLAEGLTTPAALLRIVCELAILVIGVRFTALGKKSRHRVVKMLLALFIISSLGDLMIAASSVLSVQNLQLAARGFIYLAQIYAAVNCVQYGLASRWPEASLYVVGYVLVVAFLFAFLNSFLSTALALS